MKRMKRYKDPAHQNDISYDKFSTMFTFYSKVILFQCTEVLQTDPDANSIIGGPVSASNQMSTPIITRSVFPHLKKN